MTEVAGTMGVIGSIYQKIKAWLVGSEKGGRANRDNEPREMATTSASGKTVGTQSGRGSILASASPAPANIALTVDVARQLFPIRNLGDEIELFVRGRATTHVPAGTELFAAGVPVDQFFYVIDGVVELSTPEGITMEVTGHSLKARFPLSSGTTTSVRATAKSDCQIFAVPSDIFKKFTAPNHVIGDHLLFDPNDDSLPPDVRKSAVYQAFCEVCRDDNLRIPSLPDVAMKVRQAIEQDVGVDEIVRIVQLDPAIAGKLVRVANSPLYTQGGQIASCLDAVMRLGLGATRTLVVSYSMMQIFQNKDPMINRLLKQQWVDSVYLSALCRLLAVEQPGMNAEQAQLAGLVADMGAIPFLQTIANLPDEYRSPDEVQRLLPFVKPKLGAAVLRHWEFSEDMIEVPLVGENWYSDTGSTLTFADLVILARLHSAIGTPRMAEIPAIQTLPAYSKLRDSRLTPEFSLCVLHAARSKIEEARQLLIS